MDTETRTAERLLLASDALKRCSERALVVSELVSELMETRKTDGKRYDAFATAVYDLCDRLHSDAEESYAAIAGEGCSS